MPIALGCLVPLVVANRTIQNHRIHFGSCTRYELVNFFKEHRGS
jgi:hypothetical protein